MIYQIVPSPWVRKTIPVALTAVAGAGVIGTAVLAAKATPAALEKKAEAEKEKGEPLTNWEKFKAMAPSYIPAVTTGAVTLGAIGGLVANSNRRQAELASLVAGGNQIINRVSKKYGLLRDKIQEKNPEIIREFDQKSLDDEWNDYVKEQAHKRAWCIRSLFPIENPEEWGQTCVMCFEYGNGLADENGHELIFFESTPGDVMSAIYNINGYYQSNGFVRVNDFFHELSLTKTDLGNRLVWDASVIFEEWETNYLGFNSQEIPLEDDVPEPATCILIRSDVPPLAEGYADGMGFPDLCHPTE